MQKKKNFNYINLLLLQKKLDITAKMQRRNSVAVLICERRNVHRKIFKFWKIF